MIHVAVNKKMEEAKSAIGGEVTYDAADLKPLGRYVADTPVLNTRNESIRLGTWNVRTLNHAGNMDNLTQEMEEMKTDILGISETHWSVCGVLNTEKHIFKCSGGEESRHGVGILLNSKVSKNLKGYWTINERLVMCKIEAKPFNITIIQCYAPTTDHPEKKVEQFYSQIEEALKNTNSQTWLSY